MSLVKIQDNDFLEIPKNILDKLNWKIGDELKLSLFDDEVILEKKDKKKINDLFNGYDGSYKPSEIDWGEDKGKEIL